MMKINDILNSAGNSDYVQRTRHNDKEAVFSKILENNKQKCPYDRFSKNGVIKYNGVMFVCDYKTNSICLGDVISNPKEVLNISLPGGGNLKMNINNFGDLAKAAGMFTPEDLNAIMRAIAQYNHCTSKLNEIEEEKDKIGEETADDSLETDTDGMREKKKTSLIEMQQDEDNDYRKIIAGYMADIIDKIKNGETEQKFQIGSISLTLKEWDELIDKFDDLEEEIKESVRSEIKKRIEAEKTEEKVKRDEGLDGSVLLSSEIIKTVFRNATYDEPELSYITCLTTEGIFCKRTGMDEYEYLWKIDFDGEAEYEKVKALLDSFPNSWDLRFVPNERFWKDYLSEKIDRDDFVNNLNQYSDNGKLNLLIERDGNTYINRDAAKYSNYMNNPEDRMYSFADFIYAHI